MLGAVKRTLQRWLCQHEWEVVVENYDCRIQRLDGSVVQEGRKYSYRRCSKCLKHEN